MFLEGVEVTRVGVEEVGKVLNIWRVGLKDKLQRLLAGRGLTLRNIGLVSGCLTAPFHHL